MHEVILMLVCLFNPSLSRHRVREFVPVLLKLFLLDVICWLMTYWCDVYVDPVSRRMVNLSYILWIVSTEAMWWHATIFAHSCVHVQVLVCTCSSQVQKIDMKTILNILSTL